MREPRDENEIVEALRRLAAAIDVPPPDPARERALLTAFDASRALRPTAGRRVWMTAATSLTAIVLALDWLVLQGVPGIERPLADGADPATLEEPFDLTGFVPWPGAEAWPPLERGEVLRVALPATALPALGFVPPPSVVTVVPADIVVGQDGYARAVRLVAPAR